MKDLRITQLAENVLNHSIKLTENDILYLDILGDEAMPLALELVKQARNLNAYVIFNITNFEFLKHFLTSADEKQIKMYTNSELNKMKLATAYIGITPFYKNSPLADVPIEKLELYNKYYIDPVHLKERVSNTKWCILRYPNKSMQQINNMTYEEFEDFYFKVCTWDYNKMSKAMDNLVDLINKTDKVHIIGEGTDLTFSIKNIKAEKYYGTFNLPDGEVATAPVKTSINGYITYNTETTYNGIKFNNIRFEFKDGKIINATANNTEALNKILDTDEGSRYIGEFALGLNPYITQTFNDTLFDEKIYGSFHFTPGDALKESDNGNRSAIHWDIVNIQTEEYGGGEIYFDDILIRKNGNFIIKELEPLNKENLINNKI